MDLEVRTDQLTRFYDDCCAVDRVDLRVERGTFYGGTVKGSVIPSRL